VSTATAFLPADRKAQGAWKRATPPRLLLAHGLGQQHELVIKATLAADDDQTILVVEERGVPLGLLAAYGAGVQVHVEDLAAHLAGRERCDSDARRDELQPAYEDLAAKVGWRPGAGAGTRRTSGPHRGRPGLPRPAGAEPWPDDPGRLTAGSARKVSISSPSPSPGSSARPVNSSIAPAAVSPAG
jgi:hypothetical protein